MIAEILSTGDEVRTGAVLDSNSAYIASHLEVAGVEVTRHGCVGDNSGLIAETLKEIACRADVALVTGGLGPTKDDVSAEAAALASGVTLVEDREALKAIKAFFARKDRPMNRSNLKQALLPEGARIIPNPVGTAPGFEIAINDCLFFFLPGVPYEMKRMLSDSVLPRIKDLQGPGRRHGLIKIISTFGLPESEVGERLAGFENEFPDIKLGLRAKFPEIHVRLYLRGKHKEDLQHQSEKAAIWVQERMGSAAFSLNGDSLPTVVAALLVDRKETLALAESCTGGLVSTLLTEIPGSSDYFLFSAVTYANSAKVRVLGVCQETLERYGAVHEEVAKEMAAGAREISGAVYGVSTTGIAGPSGGTEEKPVGTVCIAVASSDAINAFRFTFSFGGRSMNREVFALTALDLLRRKMLGLPHRGKC
jgi:nicotinamide-nucleotide amidase